MRISEFAEAMANLAKNDPDMAAYDSYTVADLMRFAAYAVPVVETPVRDLRTPGRRKRQNRSAQ
jgi:hypothetical protein